MQPNINNFNNIKQINNVAYNYIDRPEVKNLPPFDEGTIVQTLNNLTTVMCSMHL